MDGRPRGNGSWPGVQLLCMFAAMMHLVFGAWHQCG